MDHTPYRHPRGCLYILMNNRFIAGIDYSLCGPAICITDLEDSFTFDKCQFYFLTNKKKHARRVKSNVTGEIFSPYDGDMQRYETIADWAEEKVVGCFYIGLEGYAYNATGRVFNIAENTGVLKYKLYTRSIPIEVISPSEVKKFATKKGNASKGLMYEKFLEETNVPLQAFFGSASKEVKSPVSDIVDAYFICKYLRYEVII